MAMPVLFVAWSLGALVLFLLFPAILLLTLVLAIPIHHFVDGLVASPRLDPLLAGLFMPCATLGNQGLLLANSFSQAIKKEPVLLQSCRSKACPARCFESFGILIAISAKFFKLGTLRIEILLALPQFLDRCPLTAVRDLLCGLHAFGSCHGVQNFRFPVTNL